ncbi:DNA ligase-like protein [Parasponia andersonii]|uniref:DNA ligase-like protein n=1 Tax=Parasponia andersonii TaxID=3476 RepID=A0A2P5CBQ7_PARAD|nr:DNA ligase-like protein [Parasponia andersonii]
MFFAKATTTKKRRPEPELSNSDQRKRASKDLDLDLDLDLSSDLKGIMSALQQIRDKAQKDGRKKNEETISSVAAEIKSMIDELKSKFDKDRQGCAKALSKSSKEFEDCLKNENAKFQLLYQQFCKEKTTHLQALKDTISKFEEEKKRLLKRHEQMRKKEKSMISEHEKACSDKIARLEESLKKKTQDDKTFSILRKTLGSFLEAASDEDFPPDD